REARRADLDSVRPQADAVAGREHDSVRRGGERAGEIRGEAVEPDGSERAARDERAAAFEPPRSAAVLERAVEALGADHELAPRQVAGDQPGEVRLEGEVAPGQPVRVDL